MGKPLAKAVKAKKDSSGISSGKKAADLTREAYNDIRRMIFLNKLLPGQKVAYRALAGNLGMSLTPVVQALKHMEFLGLVRHEPNRGFFVEYLSPEEVDEVYELREVLEVSLMPKIIDRLDDESERKLKTALEEYIEASRRGFLKQRLSKDMNFHLTLAAISKQKIYVRLLRYLIDFLYLRFDQELIFSQPWDKADSEHQAIFDCVVARDVKAACDAMAQHIRTIRYNAMEGLQNRLEQLETFDF